MKINPILCKFSFLSITICMHRLCDRLSSVGTQRHAGDAASLDLTCLIYKITGWKQFIFRGTVSLTCCAIVIYNLVVTEVKCQQCKGP